MAHWAHSRRKPSDHSTRTTDDSDSNARAGAKDRARGRSTTEGIRGLHRPNEQVVVGGPFDHESPTRVSRARATPGRALVRAWRRWIRVHVGICHHVGAAE